MEIAAVEPRQSQCGRGNDETLREKCLDRSPSGDLVFCANGGANSVSRASTTVKSMTAEGSKAQSDREKLGAAIVGGLPPAGCCELRNEAGEIRDRDQRCDCGDGQDNPRMGTRIRSKTGP